VTHLKNSLTLTRFISDRNLMPESEKCSIFSSRLLYIKHVSDPRSVKCCIVQGKTVKKTQDLVQNKLYNFRFFNGIMLFVLILFLDG